MNILLQRNSIPSNFEPTDFIRPHLVILILVLFSSRKEQMAPVSFSEWLVFLACILFFSSLHLVLVKKHFSYLIQKPAKYKAFSHDNTKIHIILY